MKDIINEKARDYIRSLPYRPQIDFKKMYPNTNEKALDLLKGLLIYLATIRVRVKIWIRIRVRVRIRVMVKG